MAKDLDRTMKALEAGKRTTQRGGEYWMGRDIQIILGYKEWRNFEQTLNRARMACESTGEDAAKHFVEVNKKVQAGCDAMIPRKDYFLDRYACYLIAMNGDANKPEIGTAQTYFTIQTRKQELQAQLTEGQRRVMLRNRVTDRYKSLNKTAQGAGVQNFALFQSAGYRGLYEMSLTEIKEAKGLPSKANLLDYAGRTELAANEFRLTQTEEKIIRDDVQGEQNAVNTHHLVAKKIRDTIRELGGTMPEDLPAEDSVKKLSSKLKKINRELGEGLSSKH